MAIRITPDGNIEKLPKWAQRYISNLEREVKRHDKNIAEQDDPEARIYWETFLDDVKHGIPERAAVTFRTDNGTIELTLREGVLNVMGFYGLSISPRAGNVVEIRVTE